MSHPHYNSSEVDPSTSIARVVHIDCSDEPEHWADNEYQGDPLAIKEEPDEEVDKDPLQLDIKQEPDGVQSEKSADEIITDFEAKTNSVKSEIKEDLDNTIQANLDNLNSRAESRKRKWSGESSAMDHYDDDQHSQAPVLQKKAGKTVYCNQCEFKAASVLNLNRHKNRRK